MKPLFNKHLLYHQLARFEPGLSEAQRKAATEWANTVRKPSFLNLNEKPLQGAFLSQIFERLLGYGQVVGHTDRYFMKAETAAEDLKGGKTPDARLGFFGKEDNRTLAVLELKAPGADLDARQHRTNRQTPVEQAFSYVSKFEGCKWVLVSNFATLRLYRTVRGEGYYHEFQIADLTDEDTLQEFVFVLGRETLIGKGTKASPVERLADETHTQEEQITKEFYAFYKGVRQRLFQRLVSDNPAPEDSNQQAHEITLLEKTQKILDRVLFICFCEDTGLLPPGVIRKALQAAKAGFVRTTRWEQMLGLFDAIDKGRPDLEINQYDGGLFVHDPALRSLAVADEILDDCLRLSEYDFETDLNVNILGHIFEQSITDLEALRADIQGEKAGAKRLKRKQEGIFYTPEFVTRYIVEHSVGAWLEERFADLEAEHQPEQIPAAHTQKRRETETRLWQAYEDVLRSIKVLDPACGSGAFLVACFDFLHAEYERVSRKLAALRTGQPAQRGLFDLDRQILQENLYGVDVNPESVEITKLSLWLKTARTDKPLDNLDGNVKCGNSLIAPPAPDTPLADAFAALPDDVQAQAFDWEAAFPGVFERGGFDCVVGNPPYVRQEFFSPIKPYLEAAYASYAGTADLYTYFFERGVRLLRPGGKLSFIVSNKWMRAGYGEALRRFFSRQTVFEQIIDFGHAPIFVDADTFPCIVSLRTPAEAAAHADGEKPQPEEPVVVCPVPRERLDEISLNTFVSEEGYDVPWERYTAEPWSLEPAAVDDLVARMRQVGIPLSDFSGVTPYYGIKTGFNRAFLIDNSTRKALVDTDPGCSEITQVVLYRSPSMLKASTKRKTFNSNPRAVTA